MKKLAAALALAAISLPAGAGDTEPPAVHVYPAEIELSTSRDRQSFVVQTTAADGVTRDVTGEAQIEIPAALVHRKGNVLTPKADGRSEMAVAYGGRLVKVPVEVKDAKADRPISFKLDVMPV